MSSGKQTEKKLTKHLKELMQNPDWWFHRLPDASVCRGRIPKQPGDYLVMYRGTMALVEAKETESKNAVRTSRFTQLPKMVRYHMAGGIAFFIVSHPGDWTWRIVDIDVAIANKSSAIPLENIQLFNNVKELFYAVQRRLSKD